MCQQCLEAVQRYYPHLNEEEQCELLMSATCFPFGDADMVERQLIELREKTNGTLGAALAFAEAELYRAMTEFHEKQSSNR